MNDMVKNRCKSWKDYLAYYLVKFLRFFTDVFFRKRYGHRAVILETVAGVPGMVGAMMHHLKSLRTCKDDQGVIRSLLDEAENERMHLMAFIQVAQPNYFERILILVTQVTFFICYLLLYVISARTAHSIVGYLEEEAIISYTLYLDEIDKGKIENIKAPDIAIEYWELSKTATLRDLVIAVREDEMKHRNHNHHLADSII